MAEEDSALQEAAADQKERFQEIVDLLLAAGYFRVRISSLSPFDRVVGGLVWCITGSSEDVDVDVVFEENSTIGKKIRLGENILKALKRMKCPHPLQSHQIQGLDFAKIFPVVQWLVKKVFETRRELGDTIRNYSQMTFSKSYQLPADESKANIAENNEKKLSKSFKTYKANRSFKRANEVHEDDRQQRVRSALLEYGGIYAGAGGRRRGESRARGSDAESPARGPKTAFADDSASPGTEGAKLMNRLSLGRGSMATGELNAEDLEELDEEARMVEEEKQRALMEQMSTLTDEQRAAMQFANLGKTLDMASGEIRERSAAYQEAISKELGGLSGQKAVKVDPKVARMEAHNRQVASLNRKVATVEKKAEAARVEHTKVETAHTELSAEYKKVVQYNNRVLQEQAKLDAMETPENKNDLRRLRALVMQNETLKGQEQQFKAQCKKQMATMREKIEAINRNETDSVNDEEIERLKKIEDMYDRELGKLGKMRAVLAQKNQALALVQRQIDDIPSRVELLQYEKRFVELYEQVTAKLEETRKYYGLFNTLTETRDLMTKEVSLVESVQTQFKNAEKAKGAKEKFLENFEKTVQAVHANIEKTERSMVNEKATQDALTKQYDKLLERQRHYYKAVKEFQDEIQKNEDYSARLEEMTAPPPSS